HQRGAPIAGEPVEGEGLQVAVEGKNHVVPRFARRRAELADDASMRIDLVLDRAGLTPELAVEAFLDPGFADAESRDSHDLVLVDLALSGHAHIADHMGHGAGFRVTAGRGPVGLHAGQLRGEQGEQGEFAPREAFADQNGEIVVLPPGRPEYAVPVRRRYRRNGGDGIECRREAHAERRHHDDAKILLISCNRRARTVVNRAAHRRHELKVQPVLIGEQPILRRFFDLKLAQPPGEQAEQPRLSRADQKRAPREAVAQLLILVARHHVCELWSNQEGAPRNTAAQRGPEAARFHARPRYLARAPPAKLPRSIQRRPFTTTGKRTTEAAAPTAMGHQSTQRRKKAEANKQPKSASPAAKQAHRSHKVTTSGPAPKSLA